MAATYCPICCRASCYHQPSRYYEDPQRPMPLTPVETEVGEGIRQKALRFLGNRYKTLLARSKDFSFTEIEVQHMDELERVLETLKSMAPTGPPLPARTQEGWELSLEVT